MYIKKNKSQELHPFIKEKIVSYSKNKLPPTFDASADYHLGCYLYNDQDELVGGIVGHGFWNVMHIDFFWIDESLRGGGQGTKLLHEMELFALKHECQVMHLETFTFEAPHFYEKNDFIEFGRIKNIPVQGCDYYFFKKELSQTDK